MIEKVSYIFGEQRGVKRRLTNLEAEIEHAHDVQNALTDYHTSKNKFRTALGSLCGYVSVFTLGIVLLVTPDLGVQNSPSIPACVLIAGLVFISLAWIVVSLRDLDRIRKRFVQELDRLRKRGPHP